MADASTAQTVDLSLVAWIVHSYVAQNTIGIDQLASLISTVHRSLSGLGKSAPAPRWCRLSRSGDRCSATVSSASSAGFSARCSAGISASFTGSNPRGIASGGSCQLITQSPRRPIRNGVRRWQSGSVLVAYPGSRRVDAHTGSGRSAPEAAWPQTAIGSRGSPGHLTTLDSDPR